MADVVQDPAGTPPADGPKPRRQRDPILDLLKTMGLLGLVIAHTNPPGWLFQLRNYGIPTMAFVAGAVFVESQGRRHVSTGAYLRRRLQQLFVPTWAYVTVGSAVLIVLSTVTGEAWIYEPGRLLRSFLLLDGGVTNTQIVRVFLLLSLTAPLWAALRRTTPSTPVGLLAIAAIWGAYELLCWRWVLVRRDAHWITEIVVEDVVLCTIGFGLFFGLGTRYRELSKRTLLGIAAAFGLGLVVFLELRTNGWITTQRWKWPPRFPYLAYAGLCGLSLAALFERFDVFSRLGASTPIRTASTASLWFFFWHSFGLQLWNIFVGRNLFVVELPANVVFAYAVVVLQQRLVGRWLERDLSEPTKRRIRTVFALR